MSKASFSFQYSCERALKGTTELVFKGGVTPPLPQDSWGTDRWMDGWISYPVTQSTLLGLDGCITL